MRKRFRLRWEWKSHIWTHKFRDGYWCKRQVLFPGMVIADFFLDGFGIGKMSEDHIQQNIEFRILRGEK